MKIFENYSLLEHNSFRLNVKTRWFVEYESEDDLHKLLSDEYFFSQAFWHIGNGCNLLFLSDFNGVIVHSGIKGIEKISEDAEHVLLKVGAAEIMDDFIQYCVDKGWGGIENLSLIPSEVGASAIQNIGAYGVEAGDCIREVHAYEVKTGEKRIFSRAECEFSYRHTFFKKPEERGLYYITHVVYELSKQPLFKLDYGNLRKSLEGQELNLKHVREAVIAIRESKLPDPNVLGNAGSFFLNAYVCKAHFEALHQQYPGMPHFFEPEKTGDGKEIVKIPAAWLIDQCGFKGKTLGGAAVYDKNPLVLVNKNNATADDIVSLAKEIQATVNAKFGIELSPEVNYI
ncbi:MAG: UDP-N-acetylmuramate dehydrogenase [Candidatus Symbiothrix sp.]|jgi:UDP-N-acetylmuramate dehydrogenase|nr:UDP-N-acetylmuramate dehydrogenase [Candidatus Symbiothrix sp.]